MTCETHSRLIGRESREANDLFFTCSLIEYIARRTKNRPSAVAKRLGRSRIAKIIELADVYHSDNIDRVADDFIAEANVAPGDFDNVASCLYAVPSHWDIGKVYRRLVQQVAAADGLDLPDALLQVYASPISDKIEDYNSSFYYENPSYIYESYRAGAPL